MATVKVTLNRREIGELLKTAFDADLDAVAAVVAKGAGRRGHRRDVKVRKRVTDRAVREVSVPAYRQAKYGALSKGAAAAGLQVLGTL